MAKKLAIKLRRGQKILYGDQIKELLFNALNSSAIIKEKVAELSDRYALAVLGVIYKSVSHEISYGDLYKFGPYAIKGALILYKKDLIKDDQGVWVSLTYEGLNLAKRLEDNLGGSLELLIQELKKDISKS